MEFHLRVSAAPDSHRFVITIEPEGMIYEFPNEAAVFLTFRGPDSATAELTHYPDALIVWRPADTQVWATTADGHSEQIAGFADNPAPGLDAGGKPLGLPLKNLLENVFYDRPQPGDPAR
ncbi:hypothetical protein ACIGO9_26310 [Nocardia asteroides]|uniref:hypothetical protein n=1 Tax=Nocardia asteroides TaxID=1824 RepID=UPI0037CC1B67